MNLPEQYIANMQQLLGSDYDKYIESFNNNRYYGLKVNTDKISVEDFLKLFPYQLERVPWCKDGFYYNGEDRVSKHPYYYAGLYYLQEPSAMIPAEVLPIEKGDYVFDGCAAPGGKSVKLANKLEKSGILFSNDISASRANGLLKNIEYFGVTNAIVLSEDVNKLADYYPEYFDKILLDVPCSGEGMFRKDDGLIKSWLSKGNDYYANIQKQIVSNAIKMLAPCGMLVYSTCTFNPKEDEDIVKYMLEIDPSLKLVPLTKYEGFVDGIEGFYQVKRLYPHKIKGEGHFVALLKKDGVKREKVEKEIQFVKYENEFFDLFNISFNANQIKQINDKLVYLPANYQQEKLRILRSGLLLGTLKNQRFEPSQALALSLKKSDFKQCVDLPANDERIIKYLKGETIMVNEYDFNGYVLVCVDSYPLGWGKMNNHVIKNKMERGYLYL